MKRLVIAADLHGFYSCWLQLKSHLAEGDTLAIAGDLFDSAYGDRGDMDYQPENIRSEYLALPHPKHYVYGNCDHRDFFPGAGEEELFTFEGLDILLRHGHRRGTVPAGTNLVIEGHSHKAGMAEKGGIPHFNPGSAALPRAGVASFAVLCRGTITLFAIESGTPLGAFTI